ncbi:glycosyltransferase, MGT family [Streptoalloteichus tenebrarius]|uniref:Glycosyltransferase, MGT family n=1 Tax=Streptoalloteichus tenebrarius (strain ATCC 17920 / DSM 40477 / JCM 4838 / CBS 697.72 / NBRC 16177 / NCIMB 11028 / NRRL B-12390 / A12253. 1 / ISP 5477) TaxID=1933 RepID=A0ABT1HTI6_STRSD|nr:macrolide family glycosyltransferase [Streptoalloteichus tenebrarius]MCP2258836.1 glycosyltransferase, MGT family [Streptoalloteichus tenebrarius]BFE99479.1 glycosyltransferase [Streptoalloteichus tenebrarius]
MTRRAHIAMVSIPAPGHVHPNLEVIRELVARGHRVTYANDPRYAELVTGVGAEFVPYTSTLPTEDPGSSFDDQIGFHEVFLDDAIAMLPQLRAAYEDDRPDLFLYDIAGTPARVLAENWGLPHLQLSPTIVAWEGYEEEMAPMMEVMRQDPRGEALLRRCQQWLADNGLPHLEWTSLMGRPSRSLVLIPRALQPNADRVDPQRYTFVGPCMGDRAHQGTWTRPEGVEKVVLVSLGSAFTQQPAFYRECLRAFGDLPGWHVVLQIGKHVDLAELGALPGNVEVHRWVPQLAILEQADAFVTHAGMGGSTEGLYCGVPMIAVPQAVDQFGNADRLVELGVARRFDTDQATAEALRAALLDLTGDPEVAARLDVLRKELRAEGGTTRAADLIEAYLP